MIRILCSFLVARVKLVSCVLLTAGMVMAADAQPAVSLCQIEGVWWFRSQAGETFLSIGANHVEPVYWQSPRNTSFVRATYGGEIFRGDGSYDDESAAVKKWASRVAANFKAWSFNTLGFHNPLSRSLQEAVGGYYVCHLPVEVPWGWNMKRAELVRQFAKRPTDVFDDRFLVELAAVADKLVKPRAQDPRLLGYAYTDGPPWTVDDEEGSPAYAKLSPAQKRLHPWVHALMLQPATAAGKQAWISLLQKRHADPAKAAAVYALKATSWDEIAACTQWVELGNPDAAAADSRAFLSALMHRWYEERARSIRKHDAHHLILGDKLNMNRDRKHPAERKESLRQMHGFVDVISVQYYAPADEQVATLASVHQESGLPIINGDTTCKPIWPDSAMNGGNPEFYQALGQTYDETLTKLFAQPWFIGWHHCGYVRGLRQPYLAALKKGDAREISSYEQRGTLYREGFISDHEEPIDPILTPLKAAIAKCDELHKKSGGTKP
ncbi:hypothetical protein [Prosthecobacter sp.]|uniref:hypothetical protein n=2 Tax=Prosthecobacter sp. TaxID=1965333 RepID=UPI003783F73E